jgi:hypothetical protein
MTMEDARGRTVVRDELQTVVSMLCLRFPERNRADVERLVASVYAPV